MTTRCEFFKSAAVPGVAFLASVPAVAAADQSIALVKPTETATDDREHWLSLLQTIANPVLVHLSRRQLRNKHAGRVHHPSGCGAPFTHLEAFGRLLCGIAPWLGARRLDNAESASQRSAISLVHTCLDAATDPASPDFMNFDKGEQPLADAAFLAQGILCARTVLWDGTRRPRPQTNCQCTQIVARNPHAEAQQLGDVRRHNRNRSIDDG